ncbi:hypothetical protein, partial [Plasmodium yoelii yoelii]
IYVIPYVTGCLINFNLIFYTLLEKMISFNFNYTCPDFQVVNF